jgi:WD40 repeat protein
VKRIYALITLLALGVLALPQSTTAQDGGCVVDGVGDVINMRSGPGTDYDVVAQLPIGETAEVTGQTVGEDGYIWWRLANNLWVRWDVVAALGNCDNVPYVEGAPQPTPEPTPTPLWTGLTLTPITPETVPQLAQSAVLGPGRLRAVAWSPDGRILAAGGLAGVWLYDTEAFTVAPRSLPLPDPSAPANDLVFSADGTRLAVGYGSLTGWGGWEARVWDVATGDIIAALPHVGAVSSVAWSPDERTLLTSDETGFHIWDVAAQAEVGSLFSDRIEGLMRPLAVSPDGRWVAGTGGGGHVDIWDLETGAVQAQITTEGQVVDLVFTPDGSQVIGARADGLILVWDVAAGAEVRQLVGHTNEEFGMGLAVSPDGVLLASAGSDDTLRLWNPVSGLELARIESGLLYHVAWSPDGRVLATASMSVGLQLWGVRESTSRQMPPALSHLGLPTITPSNAPGLTELGSAGPVVPLWASDNRRNGLAWSPDGTQLFVYSDRGVWAYDALDFTRAPRYLRETQDFDITALAVGPGALVVGDREGFLRSFTPEGYEIGAFLQSDYPIDDVALIREGGIIALGQGEIIYYLSGTKGIITRNSPDAHLTLSPNGERLAYTASDETVHLWDSATGRDNPTGISGRVLAFSPTGAWLLTTGQTDDGSPAIRWWDAATYTPGRLVPVTGPGFYAGGAAEYWVFFPRDDRLMAFVDGTIDGYQLDLRDAETGGQLLWLDQLLGDRVAFSPDGSRLAWLNGDGTSYYGDGTAEVWAIRSGQ